MTDSSNTGRKKGKSKQRRKHAARSVQVDYSYLCCEHHKAMAAGLALIEGFTTSGKHHRKRMISRVRWASWGCCSVFFVLFFVLNIMASLFVFHYPGLRGFLLLWREKRGERGEEREKEAMRLKLWLRAMQISLSCYDSCQSRSINKQPIATHLSVNNSQSEYTVSFL